MKILLIQRTPEQHPLCYDAVIALLWYQIIYSSQGDIVSKPPMPHGSDMT